MDGSDVSLTNSRSAPSTKGFGLKKWRRIPRKDPVSATDTDKDCDSDSATARILKRGSPNILNQNQSRLPATDLFGATLPLNDAIFNVGGDSDNNEDSHSKSSTAASAPKSYTLTHLHPRHKNTRVKTNKSQFVIKKAEDDGSNHLEFHTCSVDASSSPPYQQQQQQQRLAEFSDGLSSSVNQRQSQLDCDNDPLVESIHLLQSAQLSLQAEVQKFGEIGKGICSLYDGSDKTSGVAIDAVVYMAHGSMCDGCNDNGYLSKSLQTLERQLNGAECSLKEKELKIVELETTLRIMDTMESPQDHKKSAMEQQYKRCIEMEAELEVLFRQKLEAEFVLVVMTRSSKDLSVLVEDRNLLSKEEVQSPRKMADVKDKVGQTEKSDTLHTGEVISEMHRRVNRLTKCFVTQLLLLVVVITLFVFQLAPKPAVVVPT